MRALGARAAIDKGPGVGGILQDGQKRGHRGRFPHHLAKAPAPGQEELLGVEEL
jgi:hypothetical protein